MWTGESRRVEERSRTLVYRERVATQLGYQTMVKMVSRKVHRRLSKLAVRSRRNTDNGSDSCLYSPSAVIMKTGV